jgi:hypothetical protein
MHSTLVAHGIVFHLSCPYTSAQNDKAERVLRTLNNSVRTLLIHASMPPAYWAEALAVATYLMNRQPSSAINHELPYYRLHGSPPAYAHLRVFGCLCYPTYRPPPRISSFLARQLACSSAIPPPIRDIAVWTCLHDGSSSLDMLSSTRQCFRLLLPHILLPPAPLISF